MTAPFGKGPFGNRSDRSRFIQLYLYFTALAILGLAGPAVSQQPDLESLYPTDIFVHGIPQPQPLYSLPVSATVISGQSIEQRGADSLNDIIDTIPGLSFSGGTNQPRFFQIRGIGEFEQYEGAPNSSVGVHIDDIDVQGLGIITSLFDIEQLEVLRGPQGTSFGAGALAGTIHLRSREPTVAPEGRVQLGLGNDSLRTAAASISGAVPGTESALRARLTTSLREQDGFRDNEYLNRDDTNKVDEASARLGLQYKPDSDITFDATVLAAQNHNGYDVFTISNSFNTQSDRPGQDSLDAYGASLRITATLESDLILEAISSGLSAEQDYSYDGDWGNPVLWDPYNPYDYFSRTDRDRDNISQELRLRGTPSDYRHGESNRWVSGIYAAYYSEDTEIEDLFELSPYRTLSSDYEKTTSALFGEIEIGLGAATAITIGARAEHQSADYDDSNDVSFSPGDTMYGGNVSLSHDLSELIRWYATAARGFKGGGFNPGTNVPDEQRIYDPEYQWSFETGVKGELVPGIVSGDIALFHARRSDAQLKFAYQNDPADPLTFVYITQSAAKAESTGLEAQLEAKVHPMLRLFASTALLNAKYTDTPAENAGLEGRAPSYAPHWQYSVGSEITPWDNWFGLIEFTGRGSHYFDDSHNEQSGPSNLVNASAGYRTSAWSWIVWARNLLDEETETRGFYFGNEPPDFTPTRYVQLGDPLSFGTTISLRF